MAPSLPRMSCWRGPSSTSSTGTSLRRASRCRTGSAKASTVMRDELLNETLFLSLDHARSRIAEWADDYNRQRPHSALGYLPPAAYAASLTATCDRLRNPDQLRRSHVAPLRQLPALHEAPPSPRARQSRRRGRTCARS